MSGAAIDLAQARASAHRFSLRTAPDCDLLAELDERINDIARYEADLAAADFTDGDADQLRGGIVYERYHVELIVGELERRERARAFGYRSDGMAADAALAPRFAAAKAIDCADILRAETGQAGTRSGDRWRFACPFHDDATPSLTTYPGERGWYCFSCGRGGDAVRLVAELKSIGAVAALRLLESESLGVAVPA